MALYFSDSSMCSQVKFRVERVEIELAALLDHCLNVTGIGITVQWLSGEGGCVGSRQELHLFWVFYLKKKKKRWKLISAITLSPY